MTEKKMSEKSRLELIGEIASWKAYAEASDREMAEMKDYSGRCFRHKVRFRPSEEFNNNCPACYWEREAKEEAYLREKSTPRRKA